MREILFRGKSVLNGEWLFGNFLKTDDGVFVIQNFDPFGGLAKYEVDHNAVCQYTGLTDKNGRKIFEGDIVKINDDIKEAFGISDGAVVYRGGSFIIGNSSGSGTLNSLFAITDINYVFRGEVIGNIFDNPELIGEQP